MTVLDSNRLTKEINRYKLIRASVRIEVNEILPPGRRDELRTENDNKSTHKKTKTATHVVRRCRLRKKKEFIICLNMTDVISQASSKHRVRYKTKPIKCACKTCAYLVVR